MLSAGRTRARAWGRPALAAPAAGAARRALCTSPLRLEPALESAISRFRSATVKSGSDRSTIVDEFTRMQSRRVKKVLLLCSDYDSYTFEEEGLLSEVIFQEYAHLNLRTPPMIERVGSTEKAISRLRESPGSYDMVITLMRNANSFVSAAHNLDQSLPIALIALSPTELTSLDPRVDQNQRVNVNKRLMWEADKGPLRADEAAARETAKSSLADAWIWPFLWHGNTSLFTGIFKLVEDRLNAKADSEVGVQLILLVEDSVKFYSSYLPMIYGEVLSLSHSIAKETMSAKERLMRMHSRPKVLLCTNYEEAVDIFSRYSDNIIGVITDAGFPKEGVHDDQAGISLAARIRHEKPDVPLLLQSAQPSESDLAKQAEKLGARFVSKNDPSLLARLREFMLDDMSFGPLTFRRGAGANEPLGSVATVTQLMHTWERLPLSSIAYHARNCDLSRWFNARAEFSLAKRFKASNFPEDFIDAQGRERPDWLRNWILSEVRAHRNKLASGVENFENGEADMPFMRLGSGSLGGKGRGFRFLNTVIESQSLANIMPDLTLVVPHCFVLATGVFDRFMEKNALLLPALSAKDDAEVVQLFAEAEMPADVVLALERYLSSMTKPLAVRSSSLFEDAFLRPFAGVYDTYMLPNTATKVSTRLDELCWAIKMVYASTYKQEARRYSDATGNRAEEEKMAVILQELVGNDHQGYFYPALAGVANSIDYYPAEGADPSHGCVQIALGLGNTVVDGVPAVQHINLGKPNKPAGPNESMMPVSALDLHARAGYDATPADAFVTLPASAAPFLTFPRVAKVEIAPEAAGARAVPGLTSDVHGEKVVFHKGYGEAAAAFDDKAVSGVVAQARRLSLKELLASEVPLAQALSFLLRLGTIGLGCPVEVEFALKLRNSPTAKHELHVLQIRPQSEITASASARALRFNYLPSELNAVVASTRALGHGSFEGIRDVVYVSPDRFNVSKTREVARQIAALNAQLKAEGRKFLLMAPGRWGSADASRGIPVDWHSIDGSAFIVETSLKGPEFVPLSQGSHFFQNIISFGIGYATADTTNNRDDVADYAYWDSLPAATDAGPMVRHVRLDKPLEVVVDGVSRRGVVMKPGKPFDVYVGQVDAFMALAEGEYGNNA